ncbi:MAG: trimethylamine methyltransferase family protein [Pseudomonadota bacterium]
MARRGRRRPVDDAEDVSPSLKAVGGTWKPVEEEDAARIADAALSIISEIGLSQAPPIVVDAIVSNDGRLENDRLRFDRAFVEEAIAGTPKIVKLCGQDPVHDLQVGGCNAFTGTGGAAPNVVDPDGMYRPSTLADLYDVARLSDALPHVQFFSRSLVARDLEDPGLLDINTTFACLTGTTKHVMVQASDPAHVAPIAEMCGLVAGSEEAFRARPFLSLHCNHIVPPLRFHAESAEVMAEGVRLGIPVHCNVFGQLGASSPVTLAGSVAQTLAEALAGVAFVHALDPQAPRIAGPRPMITDLRTGGMAGGAGEQATATAIACQVLRMWDLPCSVIAGATDSKVPDAQAGYEKALTVGTAIQAGANLVTQAAGMQAGLMGVSFAGQVIDNDMLGTLLRANLRPEVSEEALGLGAIAEVVTGEGHFLGRPETYARMKSDFLYPQLADRSSPEEWAEAGNPDLLLAADQRVREILTSHKPAHLGPDVLAELRARFDIRLA